MVSFLLQLHLDPCSPYLYLESAAGSLESSAANRAPRVFTFRIARTPRIIFVCRRSLLTYEYGAFQIDGFATYRTIGHPGQ